VIFSLVVVVVVVVVVQIAIHQSKGILVNF
jgi:hypothetical protein